MLKKNYLSRTEQEVWEYIKDKEFLDNELVESIFPEMGQNKRNKLLHSLYKKGYIKRAIKDVYYNPKNLKSFHRLALRIHPGYLGLSSALRFYNLLDYEDFTIFVITEDFRKTIRLEQYDIRYIPFDDLFIGFVKKDDINVSSVEKTLFDCLLKPSLVGFSNISKAIFDARPNWDDLLSFFELKKNHALCQRTGYILDLLKSRTKLKIPSSVFDRLLSYVKNPVKLHPGKGKSLYNQKWKVQDNLGEQNILSWWY
ncbi:MAG: hypothetical protein ABIJ08_05540 [Nanoarchaeota archaeon]